MTDGIVEMQDKLITSVHNKARKRYEELLWATEEARTRAVEVLEAMGTLKDVEGEAVLSRPHYEPALLTTLNERLKSGDVTVSHSRRWTDFEDYQIPRSLWAAKRMGHYANLELPIEADEYLVRLNDHLKQVTNDVDRRVPGNKALTIDTEKREFHLAALKASSPRGFL